LSSGLRQVFEEPKASCGAVSGPVPERHLDQILLHLSGDAFQQFQAFLLLGASARGGGTCLLRVH
jgi:hypothetical protein